jgi:hypothetical protein
MTEEERQKTILELEQQVFGVKKPKECEVCGNKLIKGECEDHPIDKNLSKKCLTNTLEVKSI